MKKQLVLILCFGVACSHLLSQELPLRFCFQSQLEQAPGGISLGDLTCPSQFSLGSNDPRLPSRLNIQSPKHLSIFGDTLRKALMSDLSASEETNPELNRIRKQRLISGLGLAASWAGTVIVDLLRYDGYRRYTLIPVVGPWITLARMGSNHDPGWPGAKALLVLSGIAQTGFATYFIISLTRHPRPKETKAVALSAGFNTVNLRILF